MAITVKPLDAPLGAEISGFDPRRLGPGDRKAIFDAWMKYHVQIGRAHV